ncbi:hypothetical protein DTO013E5_7235 [Penicillium roqueforti]|uniref:Ribosomal protein bL31m N-terminal domain-containing protein n=1 Tax=Penicillium roqueforti (strain FM164) TaxID=1365484 RepID=W6QPJ7_PENRF|nr:uncharacterized protein LCP9604111_5391 [Penicillium roqueforti]CDM37916.1 unnamed protein product [Penicillium roqueforti FM164]KAF9248641.1 hypothetical protein LCP9604111_5391 [Penicillium roqueforti]KAI1832268.1 hypothetical protein CBS147337_6948 [Penicillium roqueforti]KAI2670972.1 hypothetical protein LCP963914a_9731 [Penicillium roqueforti]KAI2671027.1 hypothetical protein CBS147355_8884 [Penicillium roqueforti]
MSMHTSLRRTAVTITNSTTTILPTRLPTSGTTFICSQCRHATLLRRPKRPYTFTQLITLSDGSTFTHRTTSPAPIYRSTRDTRNSILWNPSSSKLMNVEEDEAGRLAAFRARFGRSYDASAAPAAAAEEEVAKDSLAAKDPALAKRAEAEAKAAAKAEQEEEDNLLDLISAFGQNEAPPPPEKKVPKFTKK